MRDSKRDTDVQNSLWLLLFLSNGNRSGVGRGAQQGLGRGERVRLSGQDTDQGGRKEQGALQVMNNMTFSTVCLNRGGQGQLAPQLNPGLASSLLPQFPIVCLIFQLHCSLKNGENYMHLICSVPFQKLNCLRSSQNATSLSYLP